MIKRIFWNIYVMPLECSVILMLLVAALWPFTKKIFGKKFIWKCGNLMVSVCMIFAILVVTLLSRSSESVELILTPFHSFLEAKTQPEIYRSMLMNVFLFFPFGLTLPFALPEKWNRKALLTIVLALVLSFTIEFLQFHYRLGRAETDDVICNTLGAAIGTLSYTLERKFFTK